MGKLRIAALIAAGSAFAAWGLLYLASGMQAAEVVQKLGGLRIAITLYSMEEKGAPAAFESVLRAGQLEGTPPLKLPWHLKSSRVRNSPAFRIKDTGGWAYVNNPKDPDFGLLYIDCSHKDPKGRFWSEF